MQTADQVKSNRHVAETGYHRRSRHVQPSCHREPAYIRRKSPAFGLGVAGGTGALPETGFLSAQGVQPCDSRRRHGAKAMMTEGENQNRSGEDAAHLFPVPSDGKLPQADSLCRYS